MRLLILKLLGIVLPVALLVTVTNYFIDPANIFSSKEYVAGIAAILAKGHNVDKISNYDERLLQEQVVKRLTVSPDVVVLGSSRIMEIGTDFFPGKVVLNAGVSHASIHDLVAITGLLDSMGKLPKQVLINVDPGLISEKATTEWQSISGYYNYFLARQQSAVHRKQAISVKNYFKKTYSLISFEYFKESVLFFLKGTDKRYIDAGREAPKHYGRFSDGTICYPQEYLNPDTFMVTKAASATALKEGLSPSDTSNVRLFYSLLDFLRKRNVKVEFTMVPFHPSYYGTINQHQQNIFGEYESFFRNVADERHILMRGGFDAAAMGVERADFYDMYHCSKEALKKLFNKII